VEIQHRTVETNGIRVHLAEAGAGPLVVLCHGFPESWYSWRHQLEALAAAGFHAVAPDMRGYGGTDRPEAIEKYTLLHLVGDVVGLVDALGAADAVVVGHDWGAIVAWYAALLRPDRFRGVIALSVPYRPRGAAPPTSLMPRMPEAMFYQLYFQEPGVAEAELERDPATTMRRILVGGSGDTEHGGDGGASGAMVFTGRGFLDGAPSVGTTLPGWLSDADVEFYRAEFARSGFRGGLNWYRNLDRNWELFAAFAGARITIPALYLVGERDLIMRFPGMDKLLASLPKVVPKLYKTTVLPGCGHWTQQERPAEVNAAMIEFLHTLEKP
jgi:pimeloyl-ACP methyl ester carboxylesterase